MSIRYPGEARMAPGSVEISLLALLAMLASPLLAADASRDPIVKSADERELILTNVFNPLAERRSSGLVIESDKGLILSAENYQLDAFVRLRPRAGRIDSGAELGGRFGATVLPGQFSIAWSSGPSRFVAGRRRLDTPYFQTDDSLLIPNLFESVTVNFSASPSLQFSAWYVDAVSRWDVGDETILYQSVGESLDTQSTAGAMAFAAEYSEYGIDIQSWAYHLPDIYDLGYLEMGYDFRLNDRVEVQLNGQIDRVRPAGAALLGDVESSTLGLRAGLTWSNVTFFAAYNRLLEGSSSAPGIGGDPYFSSLQYRSFSDLNGSGSTGVAAGFQYSDASQPLEIDLAMARYQNGVGADTSTELDLSIGYAFSKNSKMGVFFSRIDHENGSQDDYRLAIGLRLQLQ